MMSPSRLLTLVAVLGLVGCQSATSPAVAPPTSEANRVFALAAAPAPAAATVGVPPGQALDAGCSTAFSGEIQTHAAHLACAEASPSPVATVVLSPTAPATLEPLPTAAPATPTPAPEPDIEGVPLCGDHNAVQWHPLVKRDANNAITCTYGHEHHDNPASVNDIFGAPGAWYPSVPSGQAPATDSISYPWMTHNAADVPENVVKHEGYKWTVRRDYPCIPAGSTGCVLAYRAEVHSRGDVSDQTTRFHSFMLEALVQDSNGHQAIVRHGGHIDSGQLLLLADNGGGQLCPGIPQDPPGQVCGKAPARESSSVNVPSPHTAHDTNLINWYTNHGITTVSPRLEPWGPIDYTNPLAQILSGAAASRNNSRGRAESLAVSLTQLPLGMVGANGLITFSGYTNRAGAIVQGCTVPGMDCVALKIEGAARQNYWWNANQPGAPFGEVREYDVVSPATQKSLIRFPN